MQPEETVPPIAEVEAAKPGRVLTMDRTIPDEIPGLVVVARNPGHRVPFRTDRNRCLPVAPLRDEHAVHQLPIDGRVSIRHDVPEVAHCLVRPRSVPHIESVARLAAALPLSSAHDVREIETRLESTQILYDLGARRDQVVSEPHPRSPGRPA